MKNSQILEGQQLTTRFSRNALNCKEQYTQRVASSLALLALLTMFSFAIAAENIQPSPTTPSNLRETKSTYEKGRPLSAGTQLKLTSSLEDSLNLIVEIDWSGDAHLPLCGSVRLKGLQLEAALIVIRSCLSRFFKKTTDLKIEEVLPRQFAVRVGRRGETLRVVRVPAQASVRSLLATEIKLNSINVMVRLLSPFGLDLVSPASSRQWDAAFDWQGGETVLIENIDEQKSEQTIDVIGEVRKPGTYAYRPAKTVIDILRDVQGPTQQAASDSIFIFRSLNGQKIETHWEDRINTVEPGDVIFVPAQKESTADKSLRWTGSLLSIVNTILLILLARG
jgi:protein involved in polysaccharide export with SLBB domain